MKSKKSDRRRFLKESAALAGLAVGTGAIRSASGQTPASDPPKGHPKDARAYGDRSRFEKSSRWPIKGNWETDVPYLVYSPSRTPLQDLAGIITPNPLHYYIDQSAAYPLPDIDPRKYRFLIQGMVDRPMFFTLDDLWHLPSVSRVHFLQCSVGGVVERNHIEFHETAQMMYGATSCAEWTGVLLSLLFKECGLQKGARYVVSEGAEHAQRTYTISLEKAMDDCLIAYAQNGEALRPENGYPVRLLVPGWQGHFSTKWLKTIKVVDRPYMTKGDGPAYAEPDGKLSTRLEPLDGRSVVTFPSGGQRLSRPGFCEIKGLAWAGAGFIRRVEVSTDNGRTWKDAQLQDPVYRKAHTRFRLPWTWDGQETVLESRCTDERGKVEPTAAEIRAKFGDNPDNWQAVAPATWKITRDGVVHQATYGPHMTPPPKTGTPADTALNLSPGWKQWSC